MKKVKQLAVSGKEIWKCLSKKIEEECGISIYNVSSEDGYFLFEFGEDTVWYFKVKECPKAFEFGMWISQDEKDLRIGLFGELEWLIDKFKPTATAFSENFLIKNFFEEDADWKKLIDDEFYKYPEKENSTSGKSKQERHNSYWSFLNSVHKFFSIMKVAPLISLYELYAADYATKKENILLWYLRLWWNNKMVEDFHNFLRNHFAKVVFNIDALILKVATLGAAKLEWSDQEEGFEWTCSPKWEIYAIIRDDSDKRGKLVKRATRAGKVFKFLSDTYSRGWKHNYLDTRLNIASTMTKEDIEAAKAVSAKRVFFGKDNLNRVEFNDTSGKFTVVLQRKIYDYEQAEHL